MKTNTGIYNLIQAFKNILKTQKSLKVFQKDFLITKLSMINLA